MKENTQQHTPEPWQQGYFIDSARTRHLPKEKREALQADEELSIFANFSPMDKGKTRSLIVRAYSKQDAARIVACVNAMQGIENPQVYISQLAYERDRAKRERDKAETQRDHLQKQVNDAVVLVAELKAQQAEMIEAIEYALDNHRLELVATKAGNQLERVTAQYKGSFITTDEQRAHADKLFFNSKNDTHA